MKISRFAALFLACAFAAAAQSTPVRETSGQSPARPAYTPGSAAPGQSPSGASGDTGTVTFHSNVPLVVLDIVVTDPHGAPVTNLTQSDFHVQEAGEPQSILNFEQAGARVPSPDLTINSTADLDRIAPDAPVQIIVLDEFNTRFEDMAFARYSLKKFLQKHPGKLSTPTMLIAVDLRRLTVLHDYTQNKDEIISSLNHHFSAYPWQAHQGAWIAERYATAFITLRRVAQAVMGHPGHKNMIWIGRGFPPFNLANAPIDSSTRLNNAVQDCVNILRDARVTLYTIDPAGVIFDPNKYGEDAAFNDPLGGNYQFAELARATGGNSLYGRNDVDAEINSAIKDGASFYTLTYRPTNSSLDPQKFRKITVALDRPGLKVLTRQGYFLRYGPDNVDPAKPSRRLVADLIAADSSNMAYDGVPFTVARSTDDSRVFLIHLSPQGLYWTPAVDAEPRHTDFVLVMSTFDKKGLELHREAKTFKIPAPSDVPAVGPIDRSIEIKYHFNPDPKAVRARFTVRITGSGRIGTQDAVIAPAK